MVIIMKSFRIIIPAILTALLLSGCVGTEPNDIAYVVAMGFDEGDNDNYKITIQFAKPTQISGGAAEEGGKGGDIVENVVVEAPNIYSAINVANNIVSKKFSLSHTKIMVFSKEIAEKGIDDILETLIRSYEVRPDTYMAVALEGAGEYLNSVKPVIEVNPAKYYQLTYEQNGSIGIPENNVLDFYFCHNGMYRDGVLPLAGVLQQSGGDSGGSEGGGSSGEGGQTGGTENEGSGGSEGESGGGSSGGGVSGEENEKQKNVPVNEEGFEYKLKNYIAGEVAISEKNKSESMGMALFSKNKMVGIMGGIESELYNIINGSYENGYISFFSEKSPQTPITVRLRKEKKPKIKVDDKKKEIEIKLYFEADFYSLPNDYLTEKDVTSFEEESKKNIEEACEKFIHKTINEYQVDLLGFSKKSRRNFLTYKDFYENCKDKTYSDYKIKVNAEFNVRHTGITIREKSMGQGG